jgi:anti-sigma factor RsiW
MSDVGSNLSGEELAELVALADGTLAPERRAAVEARVAASPELQGLLKRQRRSLAATAAIATEEPPASLRTAVEERARGGGARQRPAFGLVPRLALGGAAAAIATIALIVGLTGGPAGPTVADAARIADLPPSGPAPSRLEGSRSELAVRVDGANFPDLRPAYGWRPAGVRHDEVDGRKATVVYYEKGADRVAYVIVAGDGLPQPSDADETVRRGVELRSLSVDGKPAVTWRRVGHTCVITGNASPKELMALASWRGGGALNY